MMSNLFSTFDPSGSFNLTLLNWSFFLLPLMILPYPSFMIPSKMLVLWNTLFKYMYIEFTPIIKPSSKNSIMIFNSLFILILLNNIMSLFPYIFPSSSHMSMNLSLSLTLWLSFMIYGWTKFYTPMLSHLVPQGTPPILMPFMVLIETISSIIRPLTLAIRLTANIIAGHLLFTLISSTGPKITSIMLVIMTMSQIILFSLEISVSAIQAYVFTILSALYSSESDK